MRIWTTIFLVVATLIAAVTYHDAAEISMLMARMLFLALVVAALLYGVRLVTLQMAGPSSDWAREPLPRRQPESPASPSLSFTPPRAARHAEPREPR